MEHTVNLELNPDLFSSEIDGSNAIMLPGSKKKKNKGNSKVSEHHTPKNKPKLSKSQKRKLKKLEEEKEKAVLLSKSVEMLEKYKIGEDVYSLMWSSRNLGQVETTREKRYREVHFCKAGLELPREERSLKKRTRESTSCDVENNFEVNQSSEVTNGHDFVRSPVEKREAIINSSISLGSSRQLAFISELDNDGNYLTISHNEVPRENCELPIPDNQQSLRPLRTCNNDEETQPMDKDGENLKGSLSSCSKHAEFSSERAVIAPTIVHVLRPKSVVDSRKDLPIVMMEQEIMEAINENSCVIICGETGCGKTTQVPQFLYEAGFGSSQYNSRGGMIGVTQPRRVAVLSTAKRVAFELGVRLGKEVGFQVRHDKKIGDNCSIKFMTDGILLREVQNNFLLKRYSVIILDEAHERSLNTDILVGMLSIVIAERQREYETQQNIIRSGGTINPEDRIYPLKLVLMSATLRVEDFVAGGRIFHNPPPVIEVPTRQYPVTVHFSKRTEIVDYIGQAYKKVLSIHKKLPPGGILVFVTGQREVEYLCQKLRKASREIVEHAKKVQKEATSIAGEKCSEDNDLKEISEAFEIRGSSVNEITDRFSSYDYDNEDLSDGESDMSYDSEDDSDLEFYNNDGKSLNQSSMALDGDLVGVLGEDGSLDSLKAAFQALSGKSTSAHAHERPEAANPSCSILDKGMSENRQSEGPMCVLPLYALLPALAQLRVFEEVKKGERLVVVATNVAETSLTIPGVKYVVDTGREKVKNYNYSNGMETYEVQWISKASAAQRAGRAGRTGPGHCYRLYSSAVFNNIFPDFSVAEISKVPVDGVVLLLKSMHIPKVLNFHFPTPPEAMALKEAVTCLKVLGALDDDDTGEGWLTPMGKVMAQYPMSPRHSRMLLTVIQMQRAKGCTRANLVLAYAVAIASALSLSNPFVFQFEGSHSDTNDNELDNNSDTVESDQISEKKQKLNKNKLKETVKASRARFCNPNSDALTVAYALQCFEQSANAVEFCSSYGLQLKTMEEMSKLRKQLLQLVFSLRVSDQQPEFSWTCGNIEDVESAWRTFYDKHPLQLKEEEILCQAICAGWADRVAKRTRVVSGTEGDRKVSAVRYRAHSVKETVFLHRWSSLSKSAPEFLVYSELRQTKRPFIHGATAVKAVWLAKYARSSCTFSDPPSGSRLFYDPLTDDVYRWVIPTFGSHLWQLPQHALRLEDTKKRVKVFAYSLLEGHVLPCLKSVQKFMALPPAMILKPESSGLRRVGNLLNRLENRRRIVDSCSKLRKLWDESYQELFFEIRDWFQEGFCDRFDKLWAEMQLEIRLNTKERFSKSSKS